MFRVSAIACSSATDFLFSSAISTCVLLQATAGETPRWGRERGDVNGNWKFEGMRDTYTRLPRSPSQERRVTITDFLLAWRTTSLPDREVVDALVHPAHAGPSPGLAQVLRQWPGSYYWSDEPDGRHLVITRPLVRRPERWALHLLLFFTSGYPGYPGFLQAWATGLPFSAPLLAILLCHELGHYVVARRYQLDVSPPYFIPVPMFPTLIGTMGAFIRLRTVLSDRRQLF